jgi:hypothetical protein
MTTMTDIIIEEDTIDVGMIVVIETIVTILVTTIPTTIIYINRRVH